MIRMILLAIPFLLLQKSEVFGDFYYNKFMMNREFREQRVKFPLVKSTNTNKAMIEDKQSLHDSLIVATNKPVFVAQGNVEVVFWQTKHHNMENVFTKVGDLWYLTEIRIKTL